MGGGQSSSQATQPPPVELTARLARRDALLMRLEAARRGACRRGERSRGGAYLLVARSTR